jgi:hypothetical protein
MTFPQQHRRFRTERAGLRVVHGSLLHAVFPSIEASIAAPACCRILFKAQELGQSVWIPPRHQAVPLLFAAPHKLPIFGHFWRTVAPPFTTVPCNNEYR